MTIFDLGDLITVLVLLFLVLYFRARDSNNRSIDEVRRFLSSMRGSLEHRFQNIKNELEERSVELEAQRDLNIEYMRRGAQSYQNFMQSVEGLEATQQRLETLFDSLRLYEEQMGQIQQQFSQVAQQTEQVHKLDAHLKEYRHWAGELQKHLMLKLDEHQRLLENNLEKYLTEQKESFSQDWESLNTRLQGLEEGTAQQADALQRVVRERSEWDKVERALQSDAEHLRQKQQALREKFDYVLEQNNQLEARYESRKNQVQEFQEQLNQLYGEVEQDLKEELNRHRQELREQLLLDIQNLQREQKALLGHKTDELMRKTIEQVHRNLQEFEQWCSAYFEKFVSIEGDIKKDRNALLEQFRIDMWQEMETAKSIYGEQANELFGDWSMLSENYQRLQSDFEQIESRSREELGSQFELYEKNFIDDLRKKRLQMTEHLQLWDDSMKNQLEELARQMESSQEANWDRNREIWDRQVEVERRNLKEQLRISKQQIQGHEIEVERNIRQLMVDLKSEAKSQQENIVQQNRERDIEIRKRLEEHGSSLEQWSQNFLQMEKNMQERSRKLEEQYESLEVRIERDVQQMASNFETIEQQQQHILSNGKLIERAEQLWRETREQIARLREQNSILNTYGEQSQHLGKEFEYIKQLAQDIGGKLRALEAIEERAETLQQNVKNVEQTMEQNRSQWEAMYAQHDRIQQMEEYLRRIEEVYQDRGKEFIALEQQAQNLEAHQAQVLQHINGIKDIESRISSVEQLVGPLEEKASELSRLQDVIEQNSVYTGQVSEQISVLQRLVDIAQQRSEELERMRSWLANAEERVKKMNENLDMNIHLAEQVALQQGNQQNLNDSGVDLARIDAETRTMVFRLSEKGWDNRTIAKQLNISVGAVELILEMSSII